MDSEYSSTPGSRSEIVGRGIVGGAVAAAVMALLAMIVSAGQGTGFWAPMELIGGTFMGPETMAHPFWSAVLGIWTHLMVGAALGVVFAALARRISYGGARIAAGVTYGALVFLGMTYLVLPWADAFMFVRIDTGLFFIYHLVFGLTLPLALPAGSRRWTQLMHRGEAYGRP